MKAHFDFSQVSGCRRAANPYHARRLRRKQGRPVIFYPRPLAVVSPRVSHPTARRRAASPSAPPGAVASLLVLSLSFFEFQQRGFGLCWKLCLKRWADVRALPRAETNLQEKQGRYTWQDTPRQRGPHPQEVTRLAATLTVREWHLLDEDAARPWTSPTVRHKSHSIFTGDHKNVQGGAKRKGLGPDFTEPSSHCHPPSVPAAVPGRSALGQAPASALRAETTTGSRAVRWHTDPKWRNKTHYCLRWSRRNYQWKHCESINFIQWKTHHHFRFIKKDLYSVKKDFYPCSLIWNLHQMKAKAQKKKKLINANACGTPTRCSPLWPML